MIETEIEAYEKEIFTYDKDDDWLDSVYQFKIREASVSTLASLIL